MVLRECYADQSLFKRERSLKQTLEKWIMVKNIILRQKARVQWLSLGDSNSAFFHASIRNKITQNNITNLVSEQGEVFQSEVDIKKKATNFYKKLLGSCAE